jgi:hypothetical protein
VVCHSCSKTFPQADSVCFLSLDPESVNQLSQLLLRNGTSRLFWEPTSTRRHFHKHHNIFRTFTFLDVSWSKCCLRAIEKQLETSVQQLVSLSDCPHRIQHLPTASLYGGRGKKRQTLIHSTALFPFRRTYVLPPPPPVIFPVCAQVDSCSV